MQSLSQMSINSGRFLIVISTDWLEMISNQNHFENLRKDSAQNYLRLANERVKVKVDGHEDHPHRLK